MPRRATKPTARERATLERVAACKGRAWAAYARGRAAYLAPRRPRVSTLTPAQVADARDAADAELHARLVARCA